MRSTYNGGEKMKRCLVVVAAVVAVFVAGVVLGQVHLEFECSGVGNMAAVSPVVYSGSIDSGDLAPGYWQVTIDDTGWPSITDPEARWAYLLANYYTFDGMVWTGYFESNHLYLEKYDPDGGSMQGTCDMTFQIIDYNFNGEIDPDECMDGLSGAVIIIEDGTGVYALLCGDGTYSGSYDRDCVVGSPTYMQDDVQFGMQLDLEECGMDTETSTWSSVKSLFR
jgi:hypothetical protein